MVKGGSKMKSEEKKYKITTDIFREIRNKKQKNKTNTLQGNEHKNSDKRSSLYVSPIANIAARISPISYLAYLLLPPVVKAQPIKTSTDGTNTIVTKTGDRFNIQGGRLSADGANLFHSFRAFNLYKGQTANFSSTETIRNIITRVVDGNSSFMNGLIQVTGGNYNLYIVNPGGIIFGKHAQLNIPAAFSATTATGIEFNRYWFSATGKNNYASLVGNPNAFTFPKESAAIINHGNLAVNSGENITLMGGSIVNNGTIRAPGGEIPIAAVANQAMVRISKEGHLLSLEVAKNRWQETKDGQSIAPLSLAKMLTGEVGRDDATEVTVNKDGQLVLTVNETVVTTPDAVTISGHIDASSNEFTRRSLPPLNQENVIGVGGKMEILGDRITLDKANINVSGNAGGGTVNQGISQVDSNSSWKRKNHTQIHISKDSVISADANITGSAGNVAIAGTQINNINGHISDRGGSNPRKGRALEISGGGSFSGTVDLSGDGDNSENIILASLNRRISPVKIDKMRSQTFASQLTINLDNFPTMTETSIRESLKSVANQTGKTPAVIYVISHPEYLELLLVTSKSSPVFHRIGGANNNKLRQEIHSFIGGVSHPSPNNPDKYLTAAQKLYEWLIKPLEPELQKQEIEMLLFSIDPGMRSIPFAALHDSKQFLIEKYSMALIPSINLTDTTYKNVKNLSVLAMGASEFKDPNIVSLPAVPLELKMIRQNWRSKVFFDKDFTLENLKKQRIEEGARIIHLATHGFFKPSTPKDSFIQLWNEKLKFEQLRELVKNGKPIELLVLSACETAFGNVDAELGLAGLAVHAGVKSVLASLWQVDDGGTLGLMREFYRQLSLQDMTVKAEALRQAQIAMINNEIRLEAGRLRSGRLGDDGVKLPDDEYQKDMSFSHPYYWASFMMIGTPW